MSVVSPARAAFLAAVVVSFTQLHPASAAAIPLDINSYSLFAIDSIEFQGGNTTAGYGHIFSGNVGVNNVTPTLQTFSLAFGTSNDAIMGDNTTVVANSVTDGNAHGGDFYDLFANTLSGNFNSNIRNQGPLPFTGPIFTSAQLPQLPFTPGRPTITGNALDLSIPTNSTTFLNPGNYRNVVIHDNSTVTFAAGLYNMQDFQLGKHVTLNLDDASVFQIDQTFDPNDNDLLGGNANYNGGAFFYVGGLKPNNSGFLDPSTTRTTNFAHDSIYHLHYLAPNSWLDLGGNANSLFGTFWALTITGDQNVNISYVPPGSGSGVPEPTSLLLLALPATSLLLRRRRV